MKTFPSCADPSWTLCTWEYYFGPEYYCCRPGEMCFMAVGGNAPACGPGNLPVQSSQMVSTVSPSITRSVSGGSPAVSSLSTSTVPLSSSSSSSSRSSSSTSISNAQTQVIPSITRGSSGSGTPTVGAADTGRPSTPAAGAAASSGLSGGAIGGIVAGVVVGLALIALVGILGARYGSKRAIQNYAAEPVAPPPGYVPEPAFAWKPEEQMQQQQQQQQQNQGYRPPGPHVELETDGARR